MCFSIRAEQHQREEKSARLLGAGAAADSPQNDIFLAFLLIGRAPLGRQVHLKAFALVWNDTSSVCGLAKDVGSITKSCV